MGNAKTICYLSERWFGQSERFTSTDTSQRRPISMKSLMAMRIDWKYLFFGSPRVFTNGVQHCTFINWTRHVDLAATVHRLWKKRNRSWEGSRSFLVRLCRGCEAWSEKSTRRYAELLSPPLGGSRCRVRVGGMTSSLSLEKPYSVTSSTHQHKWAKDEASRKQGTLTKKHFDDGNRVNSDAWKNRILPTKRNLDSSRRKKKNSGRTGRLALFQSNVRPNFVLRRFRPRFIISTRNDVHPYKRRPLGWNNIRI